MLTKSGNSNAESADVTVEIDPVLSLRLSKDEINLNPSPIPEGTFVYDTLSAIVDTNNKTGYTLTMNTEEEETALAQEDGVTKIDSLVNKVTVTNTNQSDFTMNHWGYSLTSALTENNTTFNPIPALSTPDTIKTSDAPISDDTTPVTLATRVDTSLPSGTYKNTLVFTAMANYVPRVATGQLIFNANTGNSAPSTLSVDLNEETPTATLKIPNDAVATKEGNYTFGGWALSPDTKVPDYMYNDNIEVTLDNPKVTLYAVWLKNTLTTISTMQEMTPEICAGTDTPAINSAISDRFIRYIPMATLRDARDGQSYEVHKWADGNCWMRRRLNIVGPMTLTPNDTDIVSNFDLPAAGSEIALYNRGDEQLWSGLYSISGYNNYGEYSWRVVTADSGVGLISSDAPYSICPKGWMMPPYQGEKSLSGQHAVHESEHEGVGSVDGYAFYDSKYLTGIPFYNGSAWTSTVDDQGLAWYMDSSGSAGYWFRKVRPISQIQVVCVAR